MDSLTDDREQAEKDEVKRLGRKNTLKLENVEIEYNNIRLIDWTTS